MKKTKKHVNSKVTVKGRKKKWLCATMAAASGATGLPIEALKGAKAAGSDAFEANGNVDCGKLIKFLAKHPEILEAAGAQVNIRIEEALTARAKRLMVEHDLKKAEEKVLPLEEVKRDGTRFVMELKRKAFAMPKRLAQIFALETDAVTIEQKMKEELTEVFADVSKNPWTSLTCPKCQLLIQS
jgi:hypothetical protein